MAKKSAEAEPAIPKSVIVKKGEPGLVLRSNWPSEEFRRTIPEVDKQGKPTGKSHVLVFNKTDLQRPGEDELKVLGKAIGTALWIGYVETKGRKPDSTIRLRLDPQATSELLFEVTGKHMHGHVPEVAPPEPFGDERDPREDD